MPPASSNGDSTAIDSFPWSLLTTTTSTKKTTTTEVNDVNNSDTWIDWMERLLSIDEVESQVAIPREICYGTSASHSDPSLPPSQDYAAIHDAFLEALLEEQRYPNSATAPTKDGTSSVNSDSGTYHRSRRNQRRRDTSNKKRVAPLSSSERTVRSITSVASQQSLATVSTAATTCVSGGVSPESFVHEDCRLQKDKGQGETPDTAVCVEGRDACLLKVRQKMQLLSDVVPDEKGRRKNQRAAEIKRKQAVVTHHTQEYTETRSMFDLRMGFLSIKYGILLRWCNDTSKIKLVVLRKMCMETFLKQPHSEMKNAVPQTTRFYNRSGTFGEGEDLSRCSLLLERLDDGTPTILQSREGAQGLEVSLLSPPYRVSQPDEFEPASLNVSIKEVLIKQHPKKWNPYAIIRFGGEKHKTLTIRKCTSGKPYFPDGHCELPVEEKNLGESLFVQIWNSRSHQKKLLIAEVEVPLSKIEPTTSPHSSPTNLELSSVEGALIRLSVCYNSEYAWWLEQEMEARKKEDYGFWRVTDNKATVRANKPQAVEPAFMDLGAESCCIC